MKLFFHPLCVLLPLARSFSYILIHNIARFYHQMKTAAMRYPPTFACSLFFSPKLHRKREIEAEHPVNTLGSRVELIFYAWQRASSGWQMWNSQKLIIIGKIKRDDDDDGSCRADFLMNTDDSRWHRRCV
jgi:hypothetical protein